MNDVRPSTDPPADVVPAALDLSPDGWRLPLSLRVVAFGFILVGTLSVVEMFVDWFVFSRIRVDFLFVGIFIGRGLLKWRESSRGWAVFFTWLGLVLFAIWLPMAIYVVCGGPLSPGTSVGGASLPGLVGGICVMAYLLWQLYVLRRADTITRFQTPRLQRMLVAQGAISPARRGRWQFSLSSLMLATIVIAFVLVRLTSDELLYQPQHLMNSRSIGNVVYGAEYGVRTSRFGNRPDVLIYLVLSTSDGRWSSNVNRVHGTSIAGAELILPDGKRISLPGKHQLYEVVDGQFRHRDERVTKAELDDYFVSQPAEWSLDALVKHAEQMRAKYEN